MSGFESIFLLELITNNLKEFLPRYRFCIKTFFSSSPKLKNALIHWQIDWPSLPMTSQMRMSFLANVLVRDVNRGHFQVCLRSPSSKLGLGWLSYSASSLAGTFFANLLLDVVPSWRHRVFGNLVSRMPLVVLQRPDQRRPQDVQVLKRKKGNFDRLSVRACFELNL